MGNNIFDRLKRKAQRRREEESDTKPRDTSVRISHANLKRLHFLMKHLRDDNDKPYKSINTLLDDMCNVIAEHLRFDLPE